MSPGAEAPVPLPEPPPPLEPSAARPQAREFTGDDEPAPPPPADDIDPPPPETETRVRAPAPPATREESKPVVGSLRMGTELGRGAQGVVYRATPVAGGSDVAVKVLRAEASEAEVQRFDRAIDAMSALAGVEGVVHVLGRGRSSWGSPFFIMDLVLGPSLRQVLAEGRLEPRDLVALVADAAWAVHDAHDRGVVHRDLKPENILIETLADGALSARIADFGLARDVLEDPRASADGAGTPAYMAPEQVSGGEITRRTDVHALGAILYEVLAGVPPFRAATVAALARTVVEERPRVPATFWAGLPESLSSIALRALEKEPDARYPTAAALAKDIELALSGESVLGAAPVRPRKRRGGALSRAFDLARQGWLRRRAAVLGVVLGLAAGTLVGLALGRGTWLARRPEPRATRRP